SVLFFSKIIYIDRQFFRLDTRQLFKHFHEYTILLNQRIDHIVITPARTARIRQLPRLLTFALQFLAGNRKQLHGFGWSVERDDHLFFVTFGTVEESFLLK